MVELRVIFIHFCFLLEVEVPDEIAWVKRALAQVETVYFIISSKPNSTLQFSAEMSIAFAFGISNFLALKYLLRSKDQDINIAE
jgi:hypothetical protein